MPRTNQTSAAPIRLAIAGMTCAGCVAAVTRVLSRVPGADRVAVSLETSVAEIAGSATPDALLSVVRASGYGAELMVS